MTADEFLELHASLVTSEWEQTFVRDVLSRVPELDLAKVQPQTEFRDSRGKRRFIDFTISEGESVRLAIEVDGWDKKGRGTGMSPGEFEDWLFREASVVSQGWRLLRFANSTVKNDPQGCRQHIHLTLKAERKSESRLSDLAQPGEPSAIPTPEVGRGHAHKMVLPIVVALATILIVAFLLRGDANRHQQYNSRRHTATASDVHRPPPSLPGSDSPPVPSTSLAPTDVTSSYIGKQVAVQGVVNVVNDTRTGGHVQLYFQAPGGEKGLLVFIRDPRMFGPFLQQELVGKTILVSGKVASYGRELEILPESATIVEAP